MLQGFYALVDPIPRERLTFALQQVWKKLLLHKLRTAGHFNRNHVLSFVGWQYLLHLRSCLGRLLLRIGLSACEKQ
jgi:hypothetical protein